MTRHKYGAKAVVIDGVRFASQAEGRRYGELLMLLKAGKIERVQLQPKWYLHAPDAPAIGCYIADFQYYDNERKTMIYEDVKGVRTALYKWKKKHVEAQYGITITEVTRR